MWETKFLGHSLEKIFRLSSIKNSLQPGQFSTLPTQNLLALMSGQVLVFLTSYSIPQGPILGPSYFAWCICFSDGSAHILIKLFLSSYFNQTISVILYWWIFIPGSSLEISIWIHTRSHPVRFYFLFQPIRSQATCCPIRAHACSTSCCTRTLAINDDKSSWPCRVGRSENRSGKVTKWEIQTR